MSRLSDAYDRAGRRGSVVRAVLVLAGSLVAAAGFVATAASLVVGLGVAKPAAFRIAVVLGAALPLAVFLLPRASAPGGSRSLALAGAGMVAGIVGLALFWVALPAEWTGDLARLPPLAVGTYTAGLLAAFCARLAADTAERGGSRGSSDATALGGVEDAAGRGGTDRGVTVRGRGSNSTGTRDPASGGEGSTTGSPAVGDGGEDDDDVRFFDDEQR